MKSQLNNLTYNKFFQVLMNHWGSPKSKSPPIDNKLANKQIEALLKSIDPEFGLSQYMYLNSWQVSKVGALSYKSKFCLHSGIMDGENFAESIAAKLSSFLRAKIAQICYGPRF